MDKETLIQFLKSKIAVKFGPEGCYNMSEYSESAHRIFSNLTVDYDYEKIIYFLEVTKCIVKTVDDDINRAFDIATENKLL